MAFVISKKAVYPWPVNVSIPDAERPGKFKTSTFTGHFRKLSAQAAQEAVARLAEPDVPFEERYQRENEFLSDVLLGWDGITDEDGQPLAFNEDSLLAVIDLPEVRRALFDAFFDSALHRKAATKN